MANCEHAKRGRNNLFFCALMGGSKWNTCGNQHYCPKEGRPVLTEGANKCPVRDKHKGDGDKKNE